MTSEHARDVARFWGLPVPSHLKHGVNTRASRRYGCDCKLCLPSGRRRKPHGQRTPHAERQKKLRETKRGQPVPPGVKHGVYARRVYGCPCATCRHAVAGSTKRQRNHWRNRATGHWAENELGMDVIHWPPVGYGMWECQHCEEKFPHRAPKEAA